MFCRYIPVKNVEYIILKLYIQHFICNITCICF
nr:MAG TPA: hypothetical protein [Caudoviricetes sp.]